VLAGLVMAVPEFQAFLLPLLRLLADGQEHAYKELFGQMQDRLGVSDAELGELLPSKRLTRFESRVYWSATYLAQAKLIEKLGRGRLRITERGRDALAADPPRIDRPFLLRYPEFAAFSKRDQIGSESIPTTADGIDTPEAMTPEEMLEAGHHAVRRSVAEQLRTRLAACSPAFFERLVVDLLVAMGYGGSRMDAGEVVGGSGDGGIDGIIKEDKLGLDVVYLQAKRWRDPVSRPTVQAFAGSLDMHRARKGVFITTSTFTADARDFVTRIEKRIVLIDGVQLAELMIDHGIGVTEVRSYAVKRVDSDYFEEP
jgi:restriction system protein